MTERDRQRLEDMLRAIDSILRHRPDSAATFHESELLQSHFKLKLQVVGEAASRLDPGLTDTSSDIPWRKIIGMRNILVHEYEGIDLDIVWGVVDELPDLRSRIGPSWRSRGSSGTSRVRRSSGCERNEGSARRTSRA